MTKLYPSQQNRDRVWLDSELKAQFQNWCNQNGVTMKDTLEEIIRMCLEGELEIIPGKMQVKKQ